jgi:polyhydroxybutyrate depolymerase
MDSTVRGGAIAAALLALAVACEPGRREPAAEQPVAPASAAQASPGCAPGTNSRASGDRRRLTIAGTERRYLVDVPAAPGDRPLPVVLSFHGFHSSARRHRWWTGWGTLARREGFIAVHPEGHDGVRLLGRSGRGWDIRPTETGDADFVRALLDELEGDHCIDRRRIFATGMSNGGLFASLLGCALADRLAAVAPVAGAIDLRDCVPARPRPVLLIHGRADRIVAPRWSTGRATGGRGPTDAGRRASATAACTTAAAPRTSSTARARTRIAGRATRRNASGASSRRTRRREARPRRGRCSTARAATLPPFVSPKRPVLGIPRAVTLTAS